MRGTEKGSEVGGSGTCSQVRTGKAAIVTDAVERLTERGILLQSGSELCADVIVTATGLEVLPGPNVACCVLRASWCSLHGVRCMVYAAWCTLHGVRCMVYVAWCTLHACDRHCHGTRSASPGH